jgi:hypothetical protein
MKVAPSVSSVGRANSATKLTTNAPATRHHQPLASGRTARDWHIVWERKPPPAPPIAARNPAADQQPYAHKEKERTPRAKPA